MTSYRVQCVHRDTGESSEQLVTAASVDKAREQLADRGFVVGSIEISGDLPRPLRSVPRLSGRTAGISGSLFALAGVIALIFAFATIRDISASRPSQPAVAVGVYWVYVTMLLPGAGLLAFGAVLLSIASVQGQIDRWCRHFSN